MRVFPALFALFLFALVVLQIFRGIWFLAVSFECYVCVIMLLDVSDHVVVFGESTRWKFET